MYGWLDDTSNTANPQVLGKQYNEAASQDMARTIAHRFADEIIARLGGGHQRHRRDQDLLHQLAHRIEGSLGDGLRRRESACDHAPGQHFAFAARVAGQFAGRVCVAGPRGLVGSHVFAGPGAAGEFPCRHSGRRKSIAGVVGGRQRRSRSRRRARAIRKSGLQMRAAAIRSGSLISRGLMFRRRGIRAPMRRLRG